MRRNSPTRRSSERGFTLTEMLIATVIVIFGLVAVAQLVPTAVMLNSNNRNDGTALAFAQRQMEAMRAQPLSVLSFTDSTGVSCYPAGQACNLGDPTQPLQAVGCPVTTFNDLTVIDFSQAVGSCTFGYYFTYTDPNDPFAAGYDVRWAVVSNVNPATQILISRRIILGVFRRGMQTPTMPITLDVQVEK